jgi:hypothetical protein
LYQPVAIVPPVLITPGNTLLLATNGEQQQLHYKVRAMKDVSRPQLHLSAVKGWQATIIDAFNGSVLNKGLEADVTVGVKPATASKTNAKQPLLASVKANDQSYAASMRSIAYDHIPNINYFRLPEVNLLSLDLKIAGKKIGYIEGAGDYVPTALQQMGYTVKILSDANLASEDLAAYDAIITGVRAYNIKAFLSSAYDKLMRYVENGGNLIVQYNTANQISSLRAKIGPYPFTISRARITDEKAAMKLLKPEHPVMNFPNKITAKDFEGWVQERSIYHASNWDNHYETLFSMNDAGEPADEGSLIMTKYGKGSFVYTGLVFFRELPAGVPGAYRLLANLIALNQKKGF